MTSMSYAAASSSARKPRTQKPKMHETVFEFDRIPDAVIAKIRDDELASVHLTREDLKLSLQDQMNKIVMGFKNEPAKEDADEFDKPKFGPDDPLPKGYGWSSFCGGRGDKDFVVKMNCCICGVGLDHWPDDCPKRKMGKGIQK